jgi:hypothetical protein
MTDNPPPPPEEPSPVRRDFDPRRSIFPPREPAADQVPPGCAQTIGRVVLGFVSFLLAIAVFTTILAAEHPVIGVGIGALMVAGLFTIRQRSGPSPLLGAVIVGVSVAFVVFGGCLLLIFSFK